MLRFSLFLLLLVLSSCGGGGGSVAGTSSSRSGGSNNSSIPELGRIVVESILARAIPGRVTTLSFRGLDRSGQLIYGPTLRPKASRIVLEGVPVAVTQLEIGYLEGSILRGTGLVAVEVRAGAETLVEDPSFTDVTYDLTAITLTPSELELDPSQSQSLQVEGLYADGTRADVTGAALWSVSNPNIAEINGGELTALAPGSTTIEAEVGGFRSQARLIVRPLPPPAVGQIRVLSVLARAIPENITRLRFSGFNSSDQLLFGPVEFAKAPSIVLENVPVAVTQLRLEYLQDDILRGRGQVNVEVRAGAETLVEDPDFTDVLYELTSLIIAPSSISLDRGQTLLMSVLGTYADGTTSDVTSTVQWTVQPPELAEITGATLRALAIGNGRVEARLGGVSRSVDLGIAAPQQLGLRLAPQQAHIVEGGQLDLDAFASFADNTEEAVSDGSWSSSQPAVASVDPQGLVRGLAPGQTLIQLNRGGFTANTTLDVAANTTFLSLQVRPTDVDIPRGLNVQFKAFGTYVNGTEVDITDSATFDNDAPNILRNSGFMGGLGFDLIWFGNQNAPTIPPPFFPYSRSVVGGVNQGIGNVTVEFEGLTARAQARVVDPVPLEALVQPIQVSERNVGQTLQLSTRTRLSDDTQVIDRSDVSIVHPAQIALDASRLASALEPGICLLQTLLPALPSFPYPLPMPASFSPQLNTGTPDYVRTFNEPPSLVVSRDLGLRFGTATSNTVSGGAYTLLADSPQGVFGAVKGGDRLQGPSGTRVTLPRTGGLQVIGRGNFTGLPRVETFFAGIRSEESGADYGVLLSQTPTAEYAEFSDAPEGCWGGVVADFDGNGLSDVAIATGTRLKVRLSRSGVLDQAMPPLDLNLATPGSSLEKADLNEDGKPDLVVGSRHGLEVLLGQGDGTFVARPLLPTAEGGSGGFHLSVGDVDGDGHQDLLHGYHLLRGKRFYHLAFGAGDGTFPREIHGSLGFRAQEARLADLTGDGKADWVVLHARSLLGLKQAPGNTLVSIYAGSSSGLSSPQVVTLFENRSPETFVLSDTNADLKLDLVGAVINRNRPSFPTVPTPSPLEYFLLRQAP